MNRKRVFDLLFASPVFLICAPAMVAIAVLSHWLQGTAVFFQQVRPGLGGKPFKMLKFRTMSDRRGSDGTLLPDRERITRFGQWLRATSLDELPELYNVLKGEMSLVGPRPLLMQYLERYTPEQMRRHEVKPGITGWAQVNGRNAINWEEKFKLDVWYVDHHSLGLDLKIIALTLLKIVKREGICEAGQATMSEFMGLDEVQKLRGHLSEEA